MNPVAKVIKTFITEHISYRLYKEAETFFRDRLMKDKEKRSFYAYFAKKDTQKSKEKERYCILRFRVPTYMIFAAAIQYVFAYEYIESKGYIPVIDMEWEYLFRQFQLGKDNLWEYCFNQRVTVEEALKKDYVLAETFGMPGTWLNQMCVELNGKKDDHYIHAVQDNWREYYTKVNKYIKKSWLIKPELVKEYQQKYGCKIKEEDLVLGVALRESFSADAYNKMHEESQKVYDNHPMCPGIIETLEIVKKYIKQWGCNKIFLSTIFQESLELFLQEFGDSVIYVDRDRNSLNDYKKNPDGWAMNNKEIYEYHQRNSDIRNMTVTYMEEIIGLSKCDYLIAAKSSGSIAALAMNGGKYKDIYILPDKNNIERY